MPIPPFDGILNVLPPHLGDPRNPNDLSPYRCSIEEVCQRFNTSIERNQILIGLLDFRAQLFALGIHGFQWLDGSFLEDIESQEGRPPGDIDVITFVHDSLSSDQLLAAISTQPELLERLHVKTTFHVDHFWLPLSSAPMQIVDQTRYWYGLFSHRRDRLWKGMLVVDLIDNNDDEYARVALESKP